MNDERTCSNHFLLLSAVVDDRKQQRASHRKKRINNDDDDEGREENNHRCRDLTRPSCRQWLLLLLELPASDKVTHIYIQEKKNTLVVVDDV